MPKRLNPTTDRRVYSALAELTRHMRSCNGCFRARKDGDPESMCSQGMIMTLRAADDFANIIRLRIAAHTNHPDAIFACPDLVLHGQSYALTATPYHVVAIQEALF